MARGSCSCKIGRPPSSVRATVEGAPMGWPSLEGKARHIPTPSKRDLGVPMAAPLSGTEVPCSPHSEESPEGDRPSPSTLAADFETRSPNLTPSPSLSRSFEKSGLKKRLAWKSSKEGTSQNSLKMPCSGSRVFPEAGLQEKFGLSVVARVRACGGKGDGVRKRRPRLSKRWRRRLGNAMGRVRH